MALSSPIEWTNSTWNPVTGCDKVSPGCKFCYAERMARRLRAMGSENYRNGFELTIHDNALPLPLLWPKPQTIFVNSMSDLFHRDVPLEFIQKVFWVMQEAGWHQFQILTKRAERLAEVWRQLPWPRNVWMGVSVEDHRYVHRVHYLKEVPAAVRFLSVEPLLGPIPRLPLDGIDWVIAGGESGPGCRPMQADWVRDIRDQCLVREVPFFFKQWGGVHKKRQGRVLDGRTWDEMPEPDRDRQVAARSRSGLTTAG
ncbi:MAG: phage Gp37/Gp68 family protein [Candidatus Zixiibacteriota bacterium]